ncbi:MAG: hypothetical protein BGO51_05695 [Rhodospirillales bacterium 69-11]|nr:hypothetical protein [Rhodospirillales bacterium]OJW27215.1 MAG: hypothetical protein BGO51_05695 [Rhodospirillales bacterium 69-11]
MKLVRPTPPQAATIAQAMYAVVSAGGTIAPLPIEIASIDAAQRHVLQQQQPLAATPGPLPPDLERALADEPLRRMTVRLLALLPVVDRKVLPQKVAVVQEAARRLGIREYGLTILDHAAHGRIKRIALGLMSRFVAQCWSPTGKARPRDWASFVWWMLPQLHGKRTAERNRALLSRYQALGALPPGTFGYALHRFFIESEIPLPGDAKSVPWAMHEVYHVLSEYGLGLPAELLLTGFIGGTQEETCLDQMLFGLLSYHAGKQIVGGFATEGVLRPDEYFRAVARGAQINVDLMHGWDLWSVAALPLPELRARYNLPPFSEAETRELVGHNGLLTGPGYTLAAAA